MICFHTLMSLLGVVGDMRSDLVIEEPLELVYAANSIGQRLSESTTIMGSVYGICEDDKNVYLCWTNKRIEHSCRCY